jgi:hypothetical protein
MVRNHRPQKLAVRHGGLFSDEQKKENPTPISSTRPRAEWDHAPPVRREGVLPHREMNEVRQDSIFVKAHGAVMTIFTQAASSPPAERRAPRLRRKWLEEEPRLA